MRMAPTAPMFVCLVSSWPNCLGGLDVALLEAMGHKGKLSPTIPCALVPLLLLLPTAQDVSFQLFLPPCRHAFAMPLWAQTLWNRSPSGLLVVLSQQRSCFSSSQFRKPTRAPVLPPLVPMLPLGLLTFSFASNKLLHITGDIVAMHQNQTTPPDPINWDRSAPVGHVVKNAHEAPQVIPLYKKARA